MSKLFALAGVAAATLFVSTAPIPQAHAVTAPVAAQSAGPLSELTSDTGRFCWAGVTPKRCVTVKVALQSNGDVIVAAVYVICDRGTDATRYTCPAISGVSGTVWIADDTTNQEDDLGPASCAWNVDGHHCSGTFQAHSPFKNLPVESHRWHAAADVVANVSGATVEGVAVTDSIVF